MSHSASAQPTTVASVRQVRLRYGDVIALDGIDLDIPAGRMVGLIGPDGVGKSSLLSLLAGVRIIQEGTVEVLGGDMASKAHRKQVCPRIAYMPQGLGRNLYPTLSIAENLDFFAAKPQSGRIVEQQWYSRPQHLLFKCIAIVVQIVVAFANEQSMPRVDALDHVDSGGQILDGEVDQISGHENQIGLEPIRFLCDAPQ